MLDWPEVVVIAAVIILIAGAAGACILGIWNMILWFEWRYGDHARWRWNILNFLAERRATGAFVDQISYRTGLHAKHIERIIMTELVRPERSLATMDEGGLCNITEGGMVALAVTRNRMRLENDKWCV